MRVISGKYKGRRLKGPVGQELRPTGDRLKETLFNILGTRIEGSVMLDVFGGTGAIGIEALSRGAREVTFIESSVNAQRLIKHNLKLCGINSGFQIIHKDVFGALRLLARQGYKANIAYFDPPYDWEPYRDLLILAFQRGLMPQAGVAVIEHHRKAQLPESGDGYQQSRVVRQGDHVLSFYEESGDKSQESGVRSQESE